MALVLSIGKFLLIGIVIGEVSRDLQKAIR